MLRFRNIYAQKFCNGIDGPKKLDYFRTSFSPWFALTLMVELNF